MRRLLIIASLALLTQAGMAQNAAKHKPKPLNDAAMDRVTAGGFTAGLTNGVVTFQGSVPTNNGLVTGAGSMAVLTGPLTGHKPEHADVERRSAAESELADQHQRCELKHQCAAEPERQFELDGRDDHAVQPDWETLMNWRKPMLAIGLVIGLASPLIFPAPALAQNSGEEAGVQGSKNIRSLKEIRGEGVVRQKWDMSCGAAALSTVLTYDFKDPTSESAIVVWILHRVDAVRVRARGGFLTA